MVRLPSTIVCWAAVAVLGACGGGDKKPVKKPVVKNTKPEGPKPETEQDREAKRKAAALAIVPDGSTCFPVSLKEQQAPKLELAAVNKEAVICATDVDRTRLLGTVACWKIDLGDGSLVYQPPTPLPGRSMSVKLDERCARGYCIPGDAKLPEDKLVLMATSPDSTKVIIVAGDDAHIFDAAGRTRESGFSIRGDKGVTNTPSAVHWIGGSIFIEGRDAGPASYVFGFKSDGQVTGPLMTLGGKEAMASTNGGSFIVLDETRVAIAEKGFSTVTTYEIESGKRAKIVRKVTTGPCKPAEAENYWNEAGEVPAKCKDHMTKTFGHLIGADAVAGKTNLLVLLRGGRLGELAVLDVKNLAEKKSIKLPWCEAVGAAEGAAEAPQDDSKADKKKAPSKKAAEDPDAGGE
ncbi:MAG: hypothetical protein H0V17_15825 [Deltaproteobacteria bacterium]|nr:hypothetical protein [Deltaproteobacteria bacterium]